MKRTPAHPNVGLTARALVSVGAAGAVTLAGLMPGAIASIAAKTIVVVGGASDPTGMDQWHRIDGDYTGPDPVVVPYSAIFGVGFPGFALSSDQKTTYSQSVSDGADATVRAIEDIQSLNPDEQVVVYTISEGADVVGLAVLRYGAAHPAPGSGSNLTFVEQGGPSFIRTGVWNAIPGGVIPGLPLGPVRNDGVAGADVVAVCIKGDIACGVGNPISTVFYALPGFALHGSAYTAEYIGRYSPAGLERGEPYTPGSTGEAPVRVNDVVRDGRAVREYTYEDGSTKRVWEEDGTTWVVIDTGDNPWMMMLRSSGVPIPRDLDHLLNSIVPIAEPGSKNPFALPDLPRLPAVDDRAFLDTGESGTSSSRIGRHSVDQQDLIPFSVMTSTGGQSRSSDVDAELAAEEQAAKELAAKEQAAEEEPAAEDEAEKKEETAPEPPAADLTDETSEVITPEVVEPETITPEVVTADPIEPVTKDSTVKEPAAA